MPIMDGFTFCKKILNLKKEDIYIPKLMLLTSNSSKQNIKEF